MDFFLQQNNLLILSVAVLSGTMLFINHMRSSTTAVAISVRDAVELVNRHHGIFVDIRPSEQFQTGSIPQSRNIPLETLETGASKLPKDKPLIIICASGSRAGNAAGKLRKLGFKQVVSLQGGLRSWTQEGMLLTKKTSDK